MAADGLAERCRNDTGKTYICDGRGHCIAHVRYDLKFNRAELLFTEISLEFPDKSQISVPMRLAVASLLYSYHHHHLHTLLPLCDCLYPQYLWYGKIRDHRMAFTHETANMCSLLGRRRSDQQESTTLSYSPKPFSSSHGWESRSKNTRTGAAEWAIGVC